VSLIGDLERYCLMAAVAGHEDPAIRAFHADLEPLVDHISVDALGNVIGTIDGASLPEESVMVFAHLDQIGMVVQRITDDGFVKVERLGGVPERVLAAQVVHIMTESGDVVPGVVGTVAHHLTAADSKYVVPTIDKIAIDIGATSSDQARSLGVEVGRPVAYEPRFTMLGDDRVAATSLDDRGGIAVLLGVARHLAQHRPAWTVHIVGTVQEEFNLRGAMVAAQAVKPKVAISLDLVPATDAPDTSGHSDVRLGGGPVIGTYTFHGRGTLNGLLPSPRLVQVVEAAASRIAMTVQRHATVGMLTDSSYVQFVGDGVAAIDLGWPTRYTHTPVETCQLSDLEQLRDLTCAVVDSFTDAWPTARITV
jgi:putative aminopeptidase FrvX